MVRKRGWATDSYKRSSIVRTSKVGRFGSAVFTASRITVPRVSGSTRSRDEIQCFSRDLAPGHKDFRTQVFASGTVFHTANNTDNLAPGPFARRFHDALPDRIGRLSPVIDRMKDAIYQ
jgi:hypothetical protein